MYTISQVAKKLNVSRQWVWKLGKVGSIEIEYIAGCHFVSEKSLQKFLISRSGIKDKRFKIK